MASTSGTDDEPSSSSSGTKDLIDHVFSLSIQDILNDDLYKDKVGFSGSVGSSRLESSPTQDFPFSAKTILDPCQDENNDMEDGDSTPITDPSDSDSELIYSTKDDGHIAASVDETRSDEHNGMADHEDDTQDADEDEHQLSRGRRHWIGSRNINSAEFTGVLANILDISGGLRNTLLDWKNKVESSQMKLKEQSTELGRHIDDLDAYVSRYDRVLQDNRQLWNKLKELKAAEAESSSCATTMGSSRYIHCKRRKKGWW